MMLFRHHLMVSLTRIYTRGGDGGETSLTDGSRVPKHALRVEAYGTVDEANAVIGIVRLHAPAPADAMLARIQNDLFDLGADLSTPETGRKAEGALRIVPAQVKRLEQEIDAMNADLAPLKSFVLPGGTPGFSLSPPRPNGGAPGGAARLGARRGRADQPGIAQISEPPVRSFVCAGAPSERPRRNRRALEAGGVSLVK